MRIKGRHIIALKNHLFTRQYFNSFTCSQFFLFFSFFLSFLFFFFFSDVPVPTACVILLGLFTLQHFGTHKIGFIFAPVVVLWLLFIGGVGLYNILYWNRQVAQAISPKYMYKFIRNMDIKSWKSLGSVLLSIAGSFVDDHITNFQLFPLMSKGIKPWFRCVPWLTPKSSRLDRLHQLDKYLYQVGKFSIRI